MHYVPTMHYALCKMINSYLMVSIVEYRKKIVSFFFLTKDWCQPAKSSGKNALGEKKTNNFARCIGCKKEVSKFLVYCGSYLHIKFFGLPKMQKRS